MKARPAVVCPDCGALNRPTWEFCARCNESLEGATPAKVPPVAPSEGGRAGLSSAGASGRSWSRFWRFDALGVAAWRQRGSAPAPGAGDPRLFTFATRPAELPPGPSPRGRARPTSMPAAA